jgi:hypothetical protein
MRFISPFNYQSSNAHPGKNDSRSITIHQCTSLEKRPLNAPAEVEKNFELLLLGNKLEVCRRFCWLSFFSLVSEVPAAS